MKKEHFHHHLAEHTGQNFSWRPRKFFPTAPTRLFCLDYASPAAVFSAFLTKKMRQKHCQHRPILSFLLSGTHCTGLLRANHGDLAKKATGFPQIPAKSYSLTLSNYINLTAFAVIYPFLKKQTKIINQSGSNSTTIAAEKNYISLFLESNLTGNNQQQKHYHQNTPRNTGQIQRFNVNHLTPFNKKSDKYKDIVPYIKNLVDSKTVAGLTNAATNQATDILEKNSDNRLVWMEDSENSINLIYHHLCN